MTTLADRTFLTVTIHTEQFFNARVLALTVPHALGRADRYGSRVMELGSENKNGVLVPYRTETQNTLIIGKRGKSTLLANLALEQIYKGQTVLYIGDTDTILERIPKTKQKQVLYFNPSQFPFAFNFLHNIPEDTQPLFASIVLEAVKGVWGYEVPTPTLDQYIRGTVQTCLQVPDTSLVSAKFLLTSPEYRHKVIGQLHDFILKDFWADYETLTDKEKRTDTSSTLNKLRAFIFEPRVRNCLDQKDNRLDFSRTVIVSLTDSLGTDNAKLLGALILAVRYTSGHTTPVFIDDAHKYGGIVGKLQTVTPTIITSRNLDQFSKLTQQSILGATEQIVALRTTAKDAKTLEPDFHLYDQTPLSLLEPWRAYVQVGDRAIELYLDALDYPLTEQEHHIIKRCASQCTLPLSQIEKHLERFDA